MGENIVLISVGSLRSDFCPWLNNTRHQTPTLSSTASNGLSFTRAISPGDATPRSMPQVFTGHSLPSVKGEPQPMGAEYHDTIPMMLSRRGYVTIGFTPNPFTSRHYGFEEGFDYFEDFLDRDDTLLSRVRSFARENWQNQFGGAVRLGLNLLGQGDITVGWRDYYDDVLTQLEQASEPFFLWVFLLEPHWPYFPSKHHRDNVSIRDLLTNYSRSRVSGSNPTENERERLLHLYRNTIKDVDDFVRQLKQDLSEYDPVFVFHSDHGESFGEHGNWGHQGDMHEENIHVPLEVWNADVSGVVEDPISLRKTPEIITRIADGRAEDILTLASSYSRARNSDILSIAGSNWHHYPEGSDKAPTSIRELAENCLNTERVYVNEEELIREAVWNMTNELDVL